MVIIDLIEVEWLCMDIIMLVCEMWTSQHYQEEKSWTCISYLPSGRELNG